MNIPNECGSSQTKNKHSRSRAFATFKALNGIQREEPRRTSAITFTSSLSCRMKNSKYRKSGYHTLFSDK